MKTFPSLDELREYRDSGLYTMAALTTELYADVRTPFCAHAAPTASSLNPRRIKSAGGDLVSWDSIPE